MKRMRTIITIIICVILAGCATNSHEVSSQYVSPLAYQNYTCDQMIAEEARLSRKISETIGAVDQSASDAESGQVAALIFFWPALFFTQQDKSRVSELSRLKGEYDALEQASIQKSCAVQFQYIKPAEATNHPSDAPQGVTDHKGF